MSSRHEDASTAPQLATAYFFLGNSYDQLYKPAKQGDAHNDALHPEGDRELPEGRRQRTRTPSGRSLAWSTSPAAYGLRQAERPGQGRARLPGNHRPGARVNRRTTLRSPSSTRTPALRRRGGSAAKGEGRRSRTTRPCSHDLAAYYNRQGDFPKTIDALEAGRRSRARTTPRATIASPSSTGTRRGDFRLSANQKATTSMKGLAMEDKALSLNPDYMEAMTYKNILLRLQANIEKDRANRSSSSTKPISSATRPWRCRRRRPRRAPNRGRGARGLQDRGFPLSDEQQDADAYAGTNQRAASP